MRKPSDYALREARIAHMIKEDEPLETIKAFDNNLYIYIINTAYALDRSASDTLNGLVDIAINNQRRRRERQKMRKE